jgi:hypothetical protein
VPSPSLRSSVLRAEVVHDVQIGVAVAVVVGRGRRVGPVRVGDAGGCADLLERRPPRFAEQLVRTRALSAFDPRLLCWSVWRAVVADEDVEPAVDVVVEHRDALEL